MIHSDMIQGAKTLKELFDLWENKDPITVKYTKNDMVIDEHINHAANKFIYDGIVCPEIWNDKEHKKILYILKEAYTDKEVGYDLAAWLSDAPDVRIWNRIARWTYGIQNTTADRVQKYTADLSEDDYKECFRQISVINLKKSGGESGSVYEEIEAYAQADKEEIIREFELIDADIIICGYTFGILMDKVFGIDVKKIEITGHMILMYAVEKDFLLIIITQPIIIPIL